MFEIILDLESILMSSTMGGKLPCELAAMTNYKVDYAFQVSTCFLFIAFSKVNTLI